MTITLGFDVIHANIGSVPNGQLAGYITGSSSIQWTAQDWAAHPGAVRIDQSPTLDTLDYTADALDFENGAATLADLVPWATNALASYRKAARPGQRMPLVYASASNLTAIANELTKGNLANGTVGFWVANWNLSESTAILDVNSASGPFPVHAVQFKSGNLYDFDVFGSAWLSTVSRVGGPPPRPLEGFLVYAPAGLNLMIEDIATKTVTSTDFGKTWH